MQKKISLVLSVAVCACVLAGCGGSAASAASAVEVASAAASSQAASASAVNTAVELEAAPSDAPESEYSAASEAPAVEASSAAADSQAAIIPQTNTAIEAEEASEVLPDGVYSAEFVTDSSMFHANDACEGRGTLTVKDGKMTFHVSLVSKSIKNLYVGTAEDAQKDGAVILEPTVDTVTYSDGVSEEVYGFDIPVEALDTDFALAIIGKKDVWYDHTVSVCNAQPIEAEAARTDLADGTYTCEVTLEGGSGKATVESPAVVTIKDGVATATIVWSSKNYDYMLVDGEKYLPVNTDGNSTFEIPVSGFDTPLAVVGDTVAMSTPHEVEYTLTFDSSTIKEAAG